MKTFTFCLPKDNPSKRKRLLENASGICMLIMQDKKSSPKAHRKVKTLTKGHAMTADEERERPHTLFVES